MEQPSSWPGRLPRPAPRRPPPAAGAAGHDRDGQAAERSLHRHVRRADRELAPGGHRGARVGLPRQDCLPRGRAGQGRILFQIDPKPFQAQLESAHGELKAQEARHSTAFANLNRIKPLTSMRAMSQADLDKAQGEFDSSRAAVYSAQAKVKEMQLNLGYATIRSPVTGVASRALQRQAPTSTRCPKAPSSPTSPRSIRCGSTSACRRTRWRS